MRQLSIGLLVALLNGVTFVALESVKSFSKYGWPSSVPELLSILAYVGVPTILAGLAVTIPVALFLRLSNLKLPRVDPWVIQNQIWVGVALVTAYLCQRYMSMGGTTGDYALTKRDVVIAITLGAIGAAGVGPLVARFWRYGLSIIARPRGQWGVLGALALLCGGTLASVWVSGNNSALSSIAPVAAPRGKNVVLVIMDALRADHVGLYGYDRGTTPNIDRLGEHAVIATRYFTNGPQTASATASLLTSQNPAIHSVLSLQSVLSQDFQTLAEAYRDAGYATGAFVANFLGPSNGFAQGFDTYENPRDYRGDFLASRVSYSFGWRRHRTRASADMVNREVFSWLERTDKRPFFLLVFYLEPHDDYKPPRRFVERFADPDYLRVTKISDFIAAFNNLPVPCGGGVRGRGDHRRRSPAPLLEDLRDEESVAFALALYDGEIALVDEAIGELYNRLEAMGEADRTLFVITSDHGEQFLEHGAIKHGCSLHTEEIHCPLVIKDPSLERQVRFDSPIEGIDVYPTLLDASGVEPPPGLEGRSVWPAMISGTKIPPTGTVLMGEEVQGYWLDPWLLTFYPSEIEFPGDRGLELYNLEKDPEQRHDLAESHPEILERLLGNLNEKIRAGKARGHQPSTSFDEKREELLRELHYIK